jgi:hypothetical protein
VVYRRLSGWPPNRFQSAVHSQVPLTGSVECSVGSVGGSVGRSVGGSIGSQSEASLKVQEAALWGLGRWLSGSFRWQDKWAG